MSLPGGFFSHDQVMLLVTTNCLPFSYWIIDFKNDSFITCHWLIQKLIVEISNLIGLFFVAEPPSTTTQKTISPPGNRAAIKIVVSSFLFASMHQSDGEYLLYTKTKQI